MYIIHLCGIDDGVFVASCTMYGMLHDIQGTSLSHAALDPHPLSLNS